jgi:hypothetical protein
MAVRKLRRDKENAEEERRSKRREDKTITKARKLENTKKGEGYLLHFAWRILSSAGSVRGWLGQLDQTIFLANLHLKCIIAQGEVVYEARVHSPIS